MNPVIGFKKDKGYEYPRPGLVKSYLGDDNEFVTKTNKYLKQVYEYHQGIPLVRDDLKHTNVSGLNGTLYCKDVTTYIGRRDAIDDTVSYQAHNGTGRGTKGFKNMPFVDYNSKLIPLFDLYTPGMKAPYQVPV